MTSPQEREAFLDHWVADAPEEYRAAARERASKDLLLGFDRGPLRVAADAWQARAALASQPGCAVEGEALSTATVAQPVALTDAELGAAAYKGFDDYWTEDSPGKERDAWTASAKAVLKLAQPCASQGCGGAVSEAMIDAYLEANDAYWKRTDELPKSGVKWRNGTPREATREGLVAALSTAPRSLDGATPGGNDHG